MQLWFTSDWHFDHENIWRRFKVPCPACKGVGMLDLDLDPRYCSTCKTKGEVPARPFTSTAQMNDTIIENINALVKPEDHLYCLGDVAMKPSGLRQVSKITCRNLRLVFGNHDVKWEACHKAGFKKIMAYRVIDNILFSHIPVHPGSMGRFRANVHGHTHSQPSYPPTKSGEMVQPYLNISVEQTDYKPVSLGWIIKRINDLGGA